MPDDYVNEVVIQGQHEGDLKVVAVDETGQLYSLMVGANGQIVAVDGDGNIKAVLLGNAAGTLTPISLDATGKILAQLYGMHGTTPVPVAVDADGRISTMAVDQGSVAPDLDEAQGWGSGLSSLISNMNRIRYMIVTMTGEVWGTASHSIAAIWAKFHDTTGHAHSGSGSDGAPIHHGSTTGRGDDDHTQYVLVDGSRAMTGALAMGSHKITGLTSGSAAKDAVTFDQLGGGFGSWATWTPSLSWSGATPASPITTIARWVQNGKIVTIYLDISSADSNACTGLTVTLPVAPSNKGVNVPVSAIRKIGIGGINTSLYPPSQSDTYVKATSKYSVSYWPYFATDPTISLIGGQTDTCWLATFLTVTNQRFHIDLGSPYVITRLYYENFHDSGTYTDCGVKNFTVWGSNTESAFLDLVYSHDTNWTQITASQPTLDQHVAANRADPKYVTLTNSVSYRYYALKMPDNWGDTLQFGFRRVELQVASSETLTDMLGYIVADGADNCLHFYVFTVPPDGEAIRVMVFAQYEVD